MIRDSGHSASVYAIRFPGGDAPRQTRKIRVLGAKNTDWEDIAYQDGTLYVIESDQSRRARFIYEIPEPDPLGPLRVRMSARHRYAPVDVATTPRRPSSSPVAWCWYPRGKVDRSLGAHFVP